MDIKKKILEEFLNDEVVKLKCGVFEWRGHYYEVMYFPQIIKEHKASHFIKLEYKSKSGSISRFYGIREVSKKLLKSLLDK